ncbi:hypothetical protein [Thioalkalivibrio sp. ARh3]|uniref:hypothetical protein n=1 Tax=Thioalkalivibrio sp. ARh3 TaxID=1158148 RepID=UPI00056E1C9C|nr:hypothetical protein [Thioalkalivibrio sp. ARh3]
MTVELFPRLDGFAADALWNEVARLCGPVEFEDVRHPSATFTATGGTRCNFDKLRRIRNDLVQLAREHGFPDTRGDEEVRQFDFRAARYLAEDAGIPACEACRKGVWAYFTLVLMPDLTDWRFPGRKRERWAGGIRNTFGVLWRRGYLIGADHNDGRGPGWNSLEPLTQDALVQIIERPDLSASPRTARTIASVWKRIRQENPGVPMEALTRDAIRNLTAYRVTQDIDGLGDNELLGRVSAVFNSALRNFSRPG